MNLFRRKRKNLPIVFGLFFLIVVGALACAMVYLSSSAAVKNSISVVALPFTTLR